MGLDEPAAAVTRFLAAPCRHCGRPVVLDPAGTPVHTDLSYKCRDRWGTLVETYATLPRVVARAHVPPEGLGRFADQQAVSSPCRTTTGTDSVL
jgi:hypothetical protein